MPIQKSPDATLIEQSVCSQHPFPGPQSLSNSHSFGCRRVASSPGDQTWWEPPWRGAEATSELLRLVFSWIMAAVAPSLRLPLSLCQGGNGNGHLLSQLALEKVLQTSGTWLLQPSGTSEGSKWHSCVLYHLLLWMGNRGRDVSCSGAWKFMMELEIASHPPKGTSVPQYNPFP